MLKYYIKLLEEYLNKKPSPPGIERLYCPELLQELLNYKPPYMMPDPKKYFTPDITDLKIGYECEISMPQDVDFEKYAWEKFVLKSKHFNPEQPYWPLTAKIRTPFLTSEQIEGEGWKYVCCGNSWNKLSDGWYFFIAYDNTKLMISKCDDLRNGKTIYLYNGYCPSINELRMITKLLNIK